MFRDGSQASTPPRLAVFLSQFQEILPSLLLNILLLIIIERETPREQNITNIAEELAHFGTVQEIGHYFYRNIHEPSHRMLTDDNNQRAVVIYRGCEAELNLPFSHYVA